MMHFDLKPICGSHVQLGYFETGLTHLQNNKTEICKRL